MKVLDQARLWFQQGKSDKVYEVDLVEVVAGQHVVNFRYGRRGAALRDGTKTPTPVPLAKARAVFDSLVAEKTREGYVAMGEAGAPSRADVPVAPPSRAPAAASNDAALDAPSRALLAELRRGHRSKTPLHLVVRKVGDRGLAAAEPMLLELLTTAKPARGIEPRVWQHHIIAALARCGSAAAIATLEPIAAGPTTAAPHVRAVAQLALAMIGARNADAGVRAAAEARSVATLHPPVATAWRTGDAATLAAVVERELTLAPAPMLTTLLALAMLPGAPARAAVLAAARVIEVGSAFGIMRALVWSAELRRDGELYAIVAQRIERHVGSAQCQPTTRAYFRRRIARTMRRLGAIASPDFVPMAAALLLRYTDAHAERARAGSFGAHYDAFAFYHALNYLLFANSPRYERGHHHRAAWRCAGSYRPGGAAPTRREEAFPALWDRAPDQLWRVAIGARATPVAQFAVRALRDHAAFTAGLSDDALADGLADGLAAAQQLAFELARGRMPNAVLARGALASGLDEAHAWIVAWVRSNPMVVLASDELLALLITASAATARDAALTLVQAHRVEPDVARGALLRAIAILMGLTPGAGSTARAAGALAVVLRGLPEALGGVGEATVRDLLGHPVAEVAALGAEIVLARARRGEVPTTVLDALLGSQHAAVRAIGARILAETPAAVAKDAPDVLIGFALSTNVELRDGTRGLIGAVARDYPAVGRAIAAVLVQALLRKQADGAPAHVVSLLRAELASCLPRLDAAVVLRLCGALSPHARDAGGLLLPQLSPDEVGLDDIARLVSHEAIVVRRAAQALAEAARDRFALAPTALARLCDATWDDSRAWAFAFVRTFPAEVLAPDAIIAICDSVVPVVQDLGKALLRQHFRAADAGRYLLRLAEHPATNVQLLVSELLAEHGRGDLPKLAALVPYMMTVLSQVNRGGIAKRRVLDFVRAEATTSPEAAALLAPLLDRQSATDCVSHKHPLIATMVEVRDAFPAVPLPIVIPPQGGV